MLDSGGMFNHRLYVCPHRRHNLVLGGHFRKEAKFQSVFLGLTSRYTLVVYLGFILKVLHSLSLIYDGSLRYCGYGYVLV